MSGFAYPPHQPPGYYPQPQLAASPWAPQPAPWGPPPPQYAAPPAYYRQQPASLPGGAVYPSTPAQQWTAPQLAGGGRRNLEVTLCENSPLGRKGQKITLAATPDDIIAGVGEEDATYLGGYRNAAFRADEASPIILTSVDKGQQRNFTRDNTFRLVNTKVGKESPPPEIDWESGFIPWDLQDEMLGSFVNDIVVENAQGHGKALNPEMASLMRIGNGMGLAREVELWALLTTLATWATANRLSLGVGFEWNEGASSDPINDLQTMLDASAQEVTDIFLGRKAAFAMTRNPAVKDWLGSMLGDQGARNAFGDLRSFDRVADFTLPTFPPFHVVGGKVTNETTGDLDNILETDVVGISKPAGIPTNGEQIATTYTYSRRGAGGVGYESRRFRVEDRGPKGGTMIVGYRANDIVVPGPNVGFLIKNAYRP